MSSVNLELSNVESYLKELSYPLRQSSSDSYKEILNDKLDTYKKFVAALINSNPYINNIIVGDVNLTCSNILECVDHYYKGKSGESYNNLNEVLRRLSNNITYSYVEQNEDLYRMRISNETLYCNNELFHIPFNKRHLVGTQRYSIAGLPCLYLGSSHFICWYELGKPNFNNLYSSGFKATKQLKFLDVSKDIYTVTKLNDINDIVSFIKFFPIMIACNVKTKYLDAKFNDEYIISNLLLQWVLNQNEIHGIKYTSVKYYNDLFKNKISNYVLPPKDFDGNYCIELSNLFKITNPESFAVLMYGPNLGDLIAFQSIKSKNAESALLETYDTTIFGRTEEIIKNLPYRELEIK